MANNTDAPPPIRVMALHALAYCERLFFLEEVEEIRVASDRVYAGRTLHDTLAPAEGEWASVTLENEQWGIKGKVDYVRYRDGNLVPFEHKIGRSCGDAAWRSDALQIIAYAVMLSDHSGKPVPEGRIRYHASNKTIRVPIDDQSRQWLTDAIARARQLTQTIERPPVTENENLCANCALAPVCLPAEERAAAAEDTETQPTADTVRLFPAHDERRIIHLTEHGSKLRKAGLHFVVQYPDDKPPVKLPGNDVGAFILHGNVQATTQAICHAATEGIALHWLTAGGRYIAGVQPPQKVQRQLRQYAALQPENPLRIALCQKLVAAKIENQYGLIARVSRARNARETIAPNMHRMQTCVRQIAITQTPEELRGLEGTAAREYFAALPHLLKDDSALMRFDGRNRKPPKDGFNAALSFGYALLYRDVMAAIISVGLDPCIGFMHTPRSAAYPLALDIMEIFRPLLWDISLIGSVNRGQWRAEHFVQTKKMVWLSDQGKKQAIHLYENRRQEKWRHPVLGYSLSYARTIELEIRLLEKEWTAADGGLFAKLRLR